MKPAAALPNDPGEAPFHVKPGEPTAADLVRRGAGRLGMALDEPQVDRLVAFETLLRKRAVPAGLVSAADTDRLMERHILDSLRAAALVGSDDREAVDVGSGAGLPGIVVAVAHPRLLLHLVEPRGRRAAFLELAVQELELGGVSVIVGRGEDVDLEADLATARAVAPLQGSWRLARPMLRPGGRLLYFAGPLEEAPEPPVGASDVALVPNKLVDSSGPVVIITRQ